ncbi:U2 small nuclear ribonucleoprotein auxiliary factor 35 kDa subunit-related protein 2 isoform X3 [Myotis daubentonii]|uniref:U2 small nuclear ribonucleoprotein auxiliary factor 35 kDa subunit-related protein 2 isoform X3 n=1 Tax=Myotis daubentonii TaxID=98922 RepID=UPI0028739643|nr:U2 small nuclear ribonucleoprotein auxiliary factor 35 kDa subunit-related protein 2 isoform X3 [Myotis daubentonii]
MVSRAVGGKRYLQAGIAILEKETFICAGFRKTSQRRPPPAFYVGCVWAEARPALRRDRRARGSSAAAQLRAPRSPPFPAGSCGRGGAGNMAAPRAVMLPDKLSHKKYRAALKKEKRKKRRQELARLRDSGLSQKKQEEEEESFIEQQEEKLLEIERQKLHEEWLLREQKAQEEFRIKKEKEEAARKRQEEQERKLKEEWEEQQRKEKEEEEQKLQEKREREEAVQKMLERAENELENSATWQNPEPPTDVRIMEKDRANCPFYSKTGACRFGDRCSRKHNFPTSSPTLLIRSMFTTFGMEQCRRDDYDPDASLEYSEEETYQQFLDFYEDVLPEFKNVGKVIQFKVSCNLEPHLRGNVYVQYQSEEECQAAFSLFNGRWYAGRQLQCEFCPVTRWKMAICVPSSSPLADVASQHQENDNTLSFTQPTREEKSNLQLSHIICSRKEEKLDLPKTSARFHSHSPSQYTFPFILFLFFISLCISSFSLVYICSTLLHTKNNLSHPPTKRTRWSGKCRITNIERN